VGKSASSSAGRREVPDPTNPADQQDVRRGGSQGGGEPGPLCRGRGDGRTLGTLNGGDGLSIGVRHSEAAQDNSVYHD